MKPFGLAVKAVVFNGAGQCLMLRRSAANRNFVGCWEWPGGKVDPGETFTDALVREVREEAGLDVEIAGLAGATSFEMPQVRVVLLCMEARMKGGEVRLSGGHDAFDWVPLAELGKRRLAEGVSEFMADYAKARLAQ